MENGSDKPHLQPLHSELSHCLLRLPRHPCAALRHLCLFETLCRSQVPGYTEGLKKRQQLQNEVNKKFDDLVHSSVMFNEAEITMKLSQVLVGIKKTMGTQVCVDDEYIK